MFAGPKDDWVVSRALLRIALGVGFEVLGLGFRVKGVSS